ncbi:YhcB family protein [Denitromonas iodatirespirans]|uniref:Z-ring associated protein G n=1 Tax=Denitromonas iodatirespirans TaxID=2795389 RepID=A0A944D8L9_DENI1|nr:DUF1043 family protein [Denitromonas iodatirespirans]MBT0961835.1 DUF1043 family protein [Denitromonas iodatirespirans]
MMDQTGWSVVVVVALVALAVGFLIGRMMGSARQRVVDLQLELDRQKTELSDYKQEVEAHFDKTASLFVSMAGSYKDLFDHLSSGSERISAGPARKRFRERVDALLLGDDDGRPKLSAAAAGAAAAASAQADASDDADDSDDASPGVGEVTWGPEADAIPPSAPAGEPRGRDAADTEDDPADRREEAGAAEAPAGDDTTAAERAADGEDAPAPDATKHKAD